MYQVRQCPANSLDAFDHCQCKSGFQDDASQTACEPIPPPEPDDNMCKAGALVGNPILPATAEKYRAEEDLADSGPSPLNFGRYYRSSWANDASRAAIGLGAGWTHNHAFGLKASPALAPTSIAVNSPEGYVRKFVRPAGATNWTAIGSADRMSAGVNGTWVYMRADDDATLTFDAVGNLLTRATRNGWVTRYAYDAAGRLAGITNPFDRTLRLTYDAGGRLVSVTGSGARTVSYGYDASGRLYTVGYTGGRSRTLLYENTSFPNLLTGLLDEAGTRFGTFAYDSSGRAISTELAGAAERYSLMYAAGMAIVTDPIGMVRVFKYGTTAGKLAVTSNSRPSGTGSPSDDAASRTQDANGLVTSETDFKGIVTTTAWDVGRRLPVSVVRAAGTADAQTVTTQWHATFALPVLVTEAGRTTSFAYDAQAQAMAPVMMLPVLAVGYAASQGVRDAVNGMAQSCGSALGRIKNWMFSEGADNVTPSIPSDLIGDQSSDSAGLTKNGKRHTSGPMTPENGGTGDASTDFGKLTGGISQPAGGTYPPGTLVGPNGVVLRPGQKGNGPRIDIPGNGNKPPETLHY